ncbi:MAG: ParA family protein [Clostridia bacterium]|nr:ParA family protein [Clostridia bacterium]
MKYTYFCKKGGVGKTTITGEHASYLASLGKKVLMVSVDDQNSIFEMFGKSPLVFEREDNYLEHYIAKLATLEDILHPIRPNLYAIKTLNTDMLSKKLTLERPFEKQFLSVLKSLEAEFDYVFFDLPPSSNRTSEIVLDFVDTVILIVELNKLGVNGFFNTLQYFVDAGLNSEKIRYILPNGFSKNKSVPSVALEELNGMIKEHLETPVTVLSCMPEKSSIQSLQAKGVSVFDKRGNHLSSYERSQKAILKETMTQLYDQIQ